MCASCAKYDETDKMENRHKREQSLFRSQVRKHAKMDGERSIILNCAIITALAIPCAVISVVTAVICVVITLLCVVKKLCARVQRDLDLFNAIYEENKRPVWDEGARKTR